MLGDDWCTAQVDGVLNDLDLCEAYCRREGLRGSVLRAAASNLQGL